MAYVNHWIVVFRKSAPRIALVTSASNTHRKVRHRLRLRVNEREPYVRIDVYIDNSL